MEIPEDPPSPSPRDHGAGVYLHDERFVGGPRRGQALWLPAGPSVVEGRARERVAAGPVHGPVSVQVVRPEGVAHRDVGGGYVRFRDANAPGSGGDGDHVIILWMEANGMAGNGVCHAVTPRPGPPAGPPSCQARIHIWEEVCLGAELQQCCK